MKLNTEIIQEILDTGLIVVGAKKCGKSNASKIIATEIIRNQNNIQCRIFDSCQNWIHSFEPIIAQRINEETRYLYTGDRSVLYDIEYIDVERIMEAIGMIVEYDLDKQRKLKRVDMMDRWTMFFIEEAQNVLGTYSLSRESGKLWVKAISEGRNFHMAFVMVGQRIADISTKVIERAQGYLFGRTSGDNDRKKIKRIVGNAKITETINNDGDWIRITGNEIADEVAKLETGEFIYFNGKQGRLIQFPLYNADTKPINVETEKVK